MEKNWWIVFASDEDRHPVGPFVVQDESAVDAIITVGYELGKGSCAFVSGPFDVKPVIERYENESWLWKKKP